MIQKALLYCRVSSKRQKTDGSGLDSQEHRCRQHALQQGYQVEEVFPDDITGGGNFLERKGMVAMLNHIKANQDTSYVIIFDDLKRLGRNTKYYLLLRETLDELRVRVECPNFRFDSSPEGEWVETMTVANGHLERQQMARQTRQKITARFEAGYWGANAPLGYKMETDKRKPRLLIRHEPIATHIQEVLEGFACGRFETLVEAKRYLDSCPEFPKTKSKGVHTDVVKQLLTRTVYAGMVESEAWGVSLRQGHHEGLIDLKTFQHIQERLEGKSKAPQRKDLNEDFALRGAVNCASCNGAYTANWSKGYSAKYPYYICRNKGCESYGKSIRRDDMETKFGELIKGFAIARPILKTANTMFKEHWNDIDRRKEEEFQSIEERLHELDIEAERLIDKIVSSKIASVTEALENRMQKVELEKMALQEKISHCELKSADYDESFRTALEFMADPHRLWASERYEHKRALIKLSFSEKLVYDRNDGFRTAAKSSPFRLLEELSMGNTKMVGRAGFEPATN